MLTGSNQWPVMSKWNRKMKKKLIAYYSNKIVIPSRYQTNKDKIPQLLSELEDMWDEQPGPINKVKRLIEINKNDKRTVCSDMYSPGQTTRKQIQIMIQVEAIRPAGTELASPTIIAPKGDGSSKFRAVYFTIYAVTVRDSTACQ